MCIRDRGEGHHVVPLGFCGIADGHVALVPLRNLVLFLELRVLLHGLNGQQLPRAAAEQAAAHPQA